MRQINCTYPEDREVLEDMRINNWRLPNDPNSVCIAYDKTTGEATFITSRGMSINVPVRGGKR